MKTITNFLLVLTLTASMALADDGHTGSGNRCDTCPPPCTENCPGFAEEEEGQGVLGETLASEETSSTSFTEYLTEIFLDLIG